MIDFVKSPFRRCSGSAVVRILGKRPERLALVTDGAIAYPNQSWKDLWVASKRRILWSVIGLYLLLLAVVGLVVGVVTGRPLIGVLGVLAAIFVLPIIATGLRIGYERRTARQG